MEHHETTNVSWSMAHNGPIQGESPQLLSVIIANVKAR